MPVPGDVWTPGFSFGESGRGQGRGHRRIDGVAVPLIMDSCGTHKTASIRNWLAKRLRFHVHFTQTYGSWLNLVERRFAIARFAQRTLDVQAAPFIARTTP